MAVLTGSRLSRHRRSAGMTLFRLLEPKNIRPCFMLRARDRPHFRLPHLPQVEGAGAPTRRSAQIAPGQCPAAAGPWCTTVHPRLAARQRASSAYASSTLGPARSSLSLVVVSGRRPWAGSRDRRPAGALPLPPSRRLMNAPLENTARDAVGIAEFHAKHNNYFSLLVNDVCVMRSECAYVRA